MMQQLTHIFTKVRDVEKLLEKLQLKDKLMGGFGILGLIAWKEYVCFYFVQ